MTEKCVFILKINYTVRDNLEQKINNFSVEKHIYHQTMQIFTQYG